ncbi:hypothetical protein [Streptomyces sp. NBC_01268]|uniref:hypothetical protein n=1 Tax=Streptomyces sp. NBC_01268 TaxID=2903806 RepID=UPI002E3426C8|nr:hypothetical protein [Streptomyces sp. NBC_01268]
MGVFALFRRKSSTTAATDVAVAVDTAAEAGDVTEQPQGTAEPVEADAEAGTEAAEPVAAEAKAEAVEIPKQQSAEAAADNGAGEGARA